MQPLLPKRNVAPERIPMRVLVVLDHPYTIASAENVPHRRSFSAALAAAAIRGARSAGHQVDGRLLAAGHLAFVFPVWWEAMPAATKGFLDRVLTKGVMYEELPGARGNPFRNRMTNLGGVSVLSVMTTPDKAYRWWYRDPLTKIFFKGTFAKIGVKNLHWTNYASVTDKTSEE